MRIVCSHNEWDPLEEVILGIPDNACIPQDEPAYRTVLSPEIRQTFRAGLRSKESIKKAKIQFDNLERVLKFHCNVKVHRPKPMDFSGSMKTPFFEVMNQNGAECPRDTLLVLGNEIIESTMSIRARYFESMSYRNILNDMFTNDAEMLWTMAPKPTMADSLYNLDFPWDEKSKERKEIIRNYTYPTNESEPVFDAADVLRLGKDLIVQHGFTSNRKGIEWIRRHTKSRGYRVHEIHFPDDLSPVHIDCSLVPVVPPTNERKGILMNCPEKPIAKHDKERLFTGSNWEVQFAPMPSSTEVPALCQSSYWLCMNLLMTDPHTAIVEESETPTINYLESLGIKCIRVPYRDAYEFGGGIHCATCDIRRRGERLDYFPNISN